MDKPIHWSGVPLGVCERKDSGVDSVSETQDNGTTITWTGEADHPENVTCPTCLTYLRRA